MSAHRPSSSLRDLCSEKEMGSNSCSNSVSTDSCLSEKFQHLSLADIAKKAPIGAVQSVLQDSDPCGDVAGVTSELIPNATILFQEVLNKKIVEIKRVSQYAGNLEIAIDEWQLKSRLKTAENSQDSGFDSKSSAMAVCNEEKGEVDSSPSIVAMMNERLTFCKRQMRSYLHYSIEITAEVLLRFQNYPPDLNVNHLEIYMLALQKKISELYILSSAFTNLEKRCINQSHKEDFAFLTVLICEIVVVYNKFQIAGSNLLKHLRPTT